MVGKNSNILFNGYSKKAGKTKARERGLKMIKSHHPRKALTGSVVSKTERNSVTRKLVSVSSRKNNVVINSSVNDLSDDVAVGLSNSSLIICIFHN